jgi:hypothetical protein
MWIATEFVAFFNPQSNPQHTMSCMTSAYFGSPRGLVSCCKTYSCCSDKGEVDEAVQTAAAAPNRLTTSVKQRVPIPQRQRLFPSPGWLECVTLTGVRFLGSGDTRRPRPANNSLIPLLEAMTGSTVSAIPEL